MKFIDDKNFTLGVTWRWKGRKWYWKPEYIGHLDNYHRLENGKGFRFKNVTSYYIPMDIQCLWLKFIFYIKIKKKYLGGPQRYVLLEDTHLQLMDLPKCNWNSEKDTDLMSVCCNAKVVEVGNGRKR